MNFHFIDHHDAATPVARWDDCRMSRPIMLSASHNGMRVTYCIMTQVVIPSLGT